jgi:hypothetical protein
MTNSVQDKTDQIQYAIDIVNTVNSNEAIENQAALALRSLRRLLARQTPGSKEDAVASLLSLAEILTNLSTEVRVARGLLLRP